jgi:hypothetical protein
MVCVFAPLGAIPPIGEKVGDERDSDSKQTADRNRDDCECLVCHIFALT